MAGVGIGGGAAIAATGMAWGGEQLATAREAKDRGTGETIGRALWTNIKYSNPVGAALGVSQMIAPMLGIQRRGAEAGRTDKIQLEVKGDSMAAEALAKELSRHPEIVAAINERIERASAP